VRRYQHLYSESELAATLGIGRKALWVPRNRWGLRRAGSRSSRSPATQPAKSGRGQMSDQSDS